MKRSRAVPKVTVSSRHRAECKWSGFNRRIGCGCPKMLTWFRNGKLHRVTADTYDGEKAEDKAAEMMAGFEAAAKGEPTAVPAGMTGSLLEDCVKTFLASKAQSGITAKHIAKLKFELDAFAGFAMAKGLVNVGDIRTEHVLLYRNSLVRVQNTRAKKVYRLIGFFEFCVEMGWITRNVARSQAIVLKYTDTQTPKALTDAQFALLLDAVQKMNGRTTDEQRRKLRSLVLLMRWTGLAIRDAVCIERARFEKNGKGFYKLLLHRAKTGHPVYATIKTEIIEQVLAGANPEGRYLFVDSVPGGEAELDFMMSRWVVLFTKLGETAALKDENGNDYRVTSHSMRHTFVFWALNNGLPTEDVAMLLGDSVQIVAKHYSAWIAGRQERLNERMMAALK
jgi:integrase/recombinase XerD